MKIYLLYYMEGNDGEKLLGVYKTFTAARSAASDFYGDVELDEAKNWKPNRKFASEFKFWEATGAGTGMEFEVRENKLEG